MDAADIVAKPLSVIINTSLNQGIVPTMWKNAKVIPPFKGGSHLEMDSYRPISILPVLSKVMEKVVNVQLRQYLANNVICNFQCGFRRYHSTEFAALYLSDSIRCNTDKGCVTGALFIDLRKAFDSIDHNLLLAKLYAYNVVGTENGFVVILIIGCRVSSTKIVCLNVCRWNQECHRVRSLVRFYLRYL